MFEEGFTGELRLELSHEWVGLGDIKWNGIIRDLRGGGNGELVFNGYRVLVWDDTNFWRWTVVTVAQCKCI